MPWVSSEVMSVHLAEIGKVIGPTAHCLRLPPYAPELNPIENVWKYSRGNYLGHIVWDTYEQIVEAFCSAWNAFVNDSERVTSVTTRQWATVTS